MSGHSDLVLVILDANALMHFQRPNQIDWLSLLEVTSVDLVVTPALLRELEEQKVSNRSRKLRDRAHSAVLWIASLIENEAPPEIRKGVKLRFVRHSPVLDFAKHRLSHAVYDDELIASAIELREEHGGDVRFFTADTGLRLKLPAHKFRPIVPPEHLKLPSEPDEVEKENAQLKAEVARHRDRKPRLEFSFADGAQEYGVPSLRERIEAIEPEGHPGYGVYDFEHNEYVSELQRWKATVRLATGFDVQLANTGRAIATDINIALSFPEFVRAFRFPKQPQVPNVFRDRFLLDDPILEKSAPDYSDDGRSVSISLESLVHNRAFSSSEICFRFLNKQVIQPFSVRYVITCIEVIETIEGELKITVNGWQTSKAA
jgi:hypothetical protein